jgi:hypothetical protein
VYPVEMIRAFVAALALAVGAGGNGAAPVHQSEPAKVPKTVLGILWGQDGGAKARVAALDPLSLHPIGNGVPLRLGGGSATAVSPNGRLLAVGTAEPGIQVIDLSRMRAKAFLRLGGTGWVTHLFWERGLLYAVVEGDRRASLVLVDPVGWHILRRDRLGGMVVGADVGSDAGTGQIVLLTAPRRGVGPLRLTVAGGKGVRSVVVSGISGGSEVENGENGYLARQVVPGLAIDRAGRRAFIVPAGRTVAEASLSTLAIGYHSLSEPISLLGRLHNWLEPAAEAKLIEGPQRKAAWLGNGLVAVTGADYSTRPGSDGEPEVHVEAAGLAFIDTGSWSTREIDDETSDFVVFDSSLLAFGDTSWGDPGLKGIGARGYDFEGRGIFRALEGRKIASVERSGDLAFVLVTDRRRVVVDAASGRILARPKTPELVSVLTR